MRPTRFSKIYANKPTILRRSIQLPASKGVLAQAILTFKMGKLATRNSWELKDLKLRFKLDRRFWLLVLRSQPCHHRHNIAHATPVFDFAYFQSTRLASSSQQTSRRFPPAIEPVLWRLSQNIKTTPAWQEKFHENIRFLGDTNKSVPASLPDQQSGDAPLELRCRGTEQHGGIEPTRSKHRL